MKNVVAISLLALLAQVAHAQIIDAKETAKQKSEQRANNNIDRGIDNVFDRTEQGIGNLFKKKKSKQKSQPDSPEADTSQDSNNQLPESSQKTNQGNTPTGVPQGTATFKAYSKFDFVSGEKTLYFDNFERLDVGDFPADFNSNASGEVVAIDGKDGKWLALTANGTFIPEAMGKLPDNFTLEFEVGIDVDPSNNYSGFGLAFNTNAKELFNNGSSYAPGSYLYLHPGGNGSASFTVTQSDGSVLENGFQMPQWSAAGNNFAKISVWRQKGRLRVYVNETKLMDLPRFFIDTNPYYTAFYRHFMGECKVFVTNVNYAIGAPDTRSKLITEGRFSTTGIKFDSGSDKIKADSYGSLKAIADVLKENPGVRVKIIGHTDSDGNADKNLELSKKRAASVKNALTVEFAIEPARLETDGKGQTNPVEQNTSSVGKANNRRVEFIKL